MSVVVSSIRPMFALILLLLQFNGLHASEIITYYFQPSFNGPSLRMERGIYYNLINTYDNDRMVSIKPGKNCVDLYAGGNCSRTFLRVGPGPSCKMDLNNCKMRNMVCSLKLC